MHALETCGDFDDVDRARFARAVVVMQEGPRRFVPGVTWFACRACSGTGEVRYLGCITERNLGIGVCRACGGHGILAR